MQDAVISIGRLHTIDHHSVIASQDAHDNICTTLIHHSRGLLIAEQATAQMKALAETIHDIQHGLDTLVAEIDKAKEDAANTRAATAEFMRASEIAAN